MKKAIVGLMAVGAIVALWPVMRRKGHKMRQHCEQMLGQSGDRGEAGGMREHCEQMAAQFRDRGEAGEQDLTASPEHV